MFKKSIYTELIPPAPNGQTTVLDEVASAAAAVTFGGLSGKKFLVATSCAAADNFDGTVAGLEAVTVAGSVEAAQFTCRTRVDHQNLDELGMPTSTS